MFGNIIDDVKEKLDEQKDKLAVELEQKADERLEEERKKLVSKVLPKTSAPAVQTLETSAMPTPTPDMAVPGAGKADPTKVAPAKNEIIEGVPNKVLYIGGAAIAALLLLR